MIDSKGNVNMSKQSLGKSILTRLVQLAESEKFHSMSRCWHVLDWRIWRGCVGVVVVCDMFEL